MVVQVVEWAGIFGVLVWVVIWKVELRSIEGETDVLVEVNGMDNIDIGIEDSEENIEDIVGFLYKSLSNLVTKINFKVQIEMAKLSKATVFANYFEMVFHNLEIMN